MSYSIILQYPYEAIQIALCKNGTVLNTTTEHKFNAVRTTIPNIQTLLQQHNLQLQNLDFIAVNVGPGPYNTLRALLTMANGIHFVTKIPLIACDALQLLSDEQKSNNPLVLLNAFLDHVFFQINFKNTTQRGACSITTLIELIGSKKESFVALGNGAKTYKKLLLENTNNIIFTDSISEFNTISTLAEHSFNIFQNKKYTADYVKPIYFEDLKNKKS